MGTFVVDYVPKSFEKIQQSSSTWWSVTTQQTPARESARGVYRLQMKQTCTQVNFSDIRWDQDGQRGWRDGGNALLQSRSSWAPPPWTPSSPPSNTTAHHRTGWCPTESVCIWLYTWILRNFYNSSLHKAEIAIWRNSIFHTAKDKRTSMRRLPRSGRAPLGRSSRPGARPTQRKLLP